MAFEDDMTFKLSKRTNPPTYDVHAGGMGQIGTIGVYNDNSLCIYMPSGKALELGWTVNTMKGMLHLMELLESGWQSELSQWYTFVDGKPIEAASCTESVNH